jgi:hypothetical protein
MQAKEQQVNGAIIHAAKGYIEGSAGIHATIYQQAQYNQEEREEREPQRQQIQARKYHVIASQQYWNKHVSEPTNQYGHYKKDHQQAMEGDDRVVVERRKIVIAR